MTSAITWNSPSPVSVNTIGWKSGLTGFNVIL